MNLREAHLVEVGFFPSCTAKTGGQNRALAGIFRDIREGLWKQPIGELRRLPAHSAAYDQKKKRLPCFMLSASTGTGGHKAADIDHHSGLLQIDVDGLSEPEAITLRDGFGTDPHIFAAWLSPGARGVKAAMCISPAPEEHQRSFVMGQGHFRARYGVEIDSHCSDPCRLCFVSYDPDLRINEGSSPLPLGTGTAPPTGGGFRNQGERPSLNSSKSLSPDSEQYLLHNTKLFRAFPRLLPVYDRFIQQRLGEPQPGSRNKALVELVAGTFCVVHPRFVLEFADVFYLANATTFAGYAHDEYRKQAENLLAGCLRDYPAKKISPPAALIYAGLRDETERTAFRICESLAAFESDPSVPPPLFFLGAESLGDRLDELPMTAWRILRLRLAPLGVIQEVEKGRKRVKGQRRLATRWMWCLPFQKDETQ